MEYAGTLVTLFSILIPARMWVAPGQPVKVKVQTEGKVELVLTEFSGRAVEPQRPAEIAGGADADIRAIFPALDSPGTYLLYAVPAGRSLPEFLGTPLVINVRADKRLPTGANLLVTRIEPLRYAVVDTDQGQIGMIFYYDSAPNTTANFLSLASQGYYDGLTFHRIVPGFVIQGGDPRGDGRGGPGYNIGAEFNDRKHEEGVVSMARSGDPLEPQMKPRYEFANSAGSQFFICLSPREHLDGRYTAFAQVFSGMEAVRNLAKVPLADEKTGRPEKPPIIRKVEVRMVSAADNPYKDLCGLKSIAK